MKKTDSQLIKQLPKTLRIKEEIKNSIAAGLYGKVGDAFMSVRELAANTGASLVTAQKIMAMLRDEDIIGLEGRKSTILKIGFTTDGDARRENLIGLIVTNLENPFFASLTKQVELAAARKGLEVVVASSNYDPVREQEIIDMFIRGGVSGMLICPAESTDEQGNFKHIEVPFVLLGRKIDNLNTDAVLVQNFSAGKSMAEHFIDQEYRYFAYIGVNNFHNDARLQGFKSALAQHGFELPENRILLVDNKDIELSVKAMETFAGQLEHACAVFCFHDLLAARMLRVCYDLNIRVPNQLALAGFDDLPIASELIPSLTTVAYPLDLMADAACERIIKLMQGEQLRQAVVYIEPELIIRESSGGKLRKSFNNEVLVPQCMAYNIA